MNVTGGNTDVTTYFQLRNVADGTDATGKTITAFDLSYTRSGAATAAKVDATALAAADSAHADNKMIEVDATDAPGLYRVDWPDAAFAAGVRVVILTVKHADIQTSSKEIEIDAEVSVTEWNGVKLATTNPLPNAASDAAGGLPISDAGGLDMDALNSAMAEPAQAAPSNTPTMPDAVNQLYRKIVRDEVNFDGTTENTLMNDKVTVRHKRTVNVAGGVTTKEQSVSG